MGSGSSSGGGAIGGYRIGAGDLMTALKVCTLCREIFRSIDLMYYLILITVGEDSNSLRRCGYRCDAVVLQGEIDRRRAGHFHGPHI
jgi:hypothetical protein